MKTSQGQWSTKSLQEFWDKVYDETEEMVDIPSTIYFSNREKAIISKWFGEFKNKKIFKSDLWDEVKNTKLFSWAHSKGAKCYGIDISKKVLSAVKNEKYIVSKYGDIRSVPFKNDYFDNIISIGTVEHFPDTIDALKEMNRILKPGGVAMISVPIKNDLWGRFIFIGLLQKLGLYKYGYEIHYTKGEFRRLLKKAKFNIEDEEGYLFFPSQLRILDYIFREKNFKFGNKMLSKIFDFFYFLESRSRRLSDLGYMAAFKCTKKV